MFCNFFSADLPTEQQYERATRGFNGGTNFSGGGYNAHVNVKEVDATFPFVDRVEFAVQLVNREDKCELEYFKGLLKELEVDAKNNDDYYKHVINKPDKISFTNKYLNNSLGSSW